MIKVLMLTFLLLLLVACDKEEVTVVNNAGEDVKVNVEITDTDEERARGLMFRENLKENEGMLFVFQREDYHNFWMKNTLIPLDILWISEDLEIVDIKHAVPCEQDPCISYRPNGPAKYVLEVNSGFTGKNNINVSNKVVLD